MPSSRSVARAAAAVLATISAAALVRPVVADAPLATAPAGAEPQEALLLQQPTISDAHVVFVHAQDLWIVPREGGEARRLTSDAGIEALPHLSPDGRRVAFTGQYDGNSDAYVMSVDGGLPKRLTWHPALDRVAGWHPDGRRVIFTSARGGVPAAEQAYLVSADGGPPESLPLPSVWHVSIGSGEGRIAYTPWPDAFRTWKRYRGGRTVPIWVVDPATLDVEQVPHVNASDTFPCWVAGTLFFLSDRDGHMNVWRWSHGMSEPVRVTRFTDYDVRSLDAGGGALVFEQAGAIHVLDPATGATTRLRVTMRSDGLWRAPRYESVKGFVRGATVSPLGQRAAFEARGEIVTVPREFGDWRNLTSTPGAFERDPAWSPDGKKIAYFSDESGEYRLVVRDDRGREAGKSYDLGGAGFYFSPTWSPDGKHVLASDRANRLAFVTLESGKVTEVLPAQASLGSITPAGAWSPDSQWIAFERRDHETGYDRIDLFEVATGKTYPVTPGMGSADSPAFSRDGKHLFFAASTDSGPRRFGLDMSAMASRDPSSSLYVAVLKKTLKSPLAPRSDEGDVKPPGGPGGGGGPGRERPGMDGDDKKPDDEKKGDEKKGDEKKGDEKKPDDAEKKDKKDEGAKDEKEGPEAGKPPAKESGPSIDVEGIDQRILALPVPPGTYYGLSCGKDRLYYLARGEAAPRGDRGDPRERGGTLFSFDFEERKPKELLRGVGSYEVAAGGQHLLVQAAGAWQVTDASGKNEKRLDVDSVRVRVEPEREWRQMLRDAWRIERDYFYDPHMHGVDWPAMWDRYAAFLPHVHHRAELNLLIGEMIGELACGHEYVSGGETPPAPAGASVGLLGADLAVADGHWRITRIYRGQNWSPDLRAPLTEPGVDAKEGDYLLSVDGKPLSISDDPYAAFEGTADRQTDLVLSAAADGSKPRTVTVVPLGNDHELRRRAWVEDNRKKVDEMGKGRVAYVYMPDTGGAGLAAFERDFYAQLGREGLVLDERYNAGGKIADAVVGRLSQGVLCHWVSREGWAGRTPFGSMPGPKAMIVNQLAGSGGDALPWMFKKMKLGPLVGVRTWGGLVGISGYPPLMDGGSVTAAAFGIMDTDGRWVVENEGVAPDVEVFEYPKDCVDGRDPQLEKAVALVLEAIERTPPPKKPDVSPPAPR